MVRELFELHKGQFSLDRWTHGDEGALDAVQRETIDSVLCGYGPLSGRQLSVLTHAEDPWKNARAGLAPTDRSSTEITHEALSEYYSVVDQADGALPLDELDWDSWERSADCQHGET